MNFLAFDDSALLALLTKDLILECLFSVCPAVCLKEETIILLTRFGILIYSSFISSAGGLYSGGSAQMVENSLNIHGDEILYVGDHIYTDVSQSKVHLRWRTALICRELEEEVRVCYFIVLTILYCTWKQNFMCFKSSVVLFCSNILL